MKYGPIFTNVQHIGYSRIRLLTVNFVQKLDIFRQKYSKWSFLVSNTKVWPLAPWLLWPSLVVPAFWNSHHFHVVWIFTCRKICSVAELHRQKGSAELRQIFAKYAVSADVVRRIISSATVFENCLTYMLMQTKVSSGIADGLAAGWRAWHAGSIPSTASDMIWEQVVAHKKICSVLRRSVFENMRILDILLLIV